jgi:polysaccharide pyruvyl transferase WcaK-like protein
MTKSNDPILLLGSYGRGNIGDDAFLAAALKHFSPDTPLYLNSAYDELLPRAAQGRVQTISTTENSDLRKKFKVFRSIKHVVYCGGDLWVELYGDRYPRASLYKMLGMNLLARLSGKKVHYLGCGIGNLSGYSLALARASARLANTVVVREPRSAKVLNRKGTLVMPDLVTSLNWPTSSRPRTRKKPFTIGISVLYHVPNPEYAFPQLIQTLATVISSLPAEDFKIVLFPMLISPSDAHDDLWASRQLQQAMPTVDVEISKSREVEDFVREIGEVDLMIGARLHADIFALMTGTPAIGIAYRPKVASFFSAHGLKDYSIELSKLDPPSLCELFWDMYENYDQVAQRYAAARARAIQEGAAYQTFIERHF